MNYDFITIPRDIVLSNKIRDSDRLVYGVIYSMSQMNNKRFTGKNTTISKMCGISAGSVANSLVRLSEAGYIKCSFKDTNKRVRTEILPLVNYNNTEEYHQVMTQVSSNDETKVSSNDEQNNIYIINNNISNTLIDDIYKELYKINKFIGNIRYKKEQKEAINLLLTGNTDNVLNVITWYVSERIKGLNKYLPVANAPTQLVEKWSRIEELFNKQNKSGSSSMEDLFDEYNK